MKRVPAASLALLVLTAATTSAQSTEFDLIDKDLACALWQLGGYSRGQTQAPPDTAPMLLMLFGVPSRDVQLTHGYDRATLVGNGGSAEVEVRWARQSVAIIETAISGSQHTLTLLSARDDTRPRSALEYVATYTRHTIPLTLRSDEAPGQPIISQYRGKCVPWSIATGRFSNRVGHWPTLPPALKQDE